MRKDGSRGRGNSARLPKHVCWPLKDAWRNRVRREFKLGNLTRGYRDVLLRLPSFRGPNGDLFPSHAAIAKRVGYNERTVHRALAMGARAGSWCAVVPRRTKPRAGGSEPQTSIF